ncbi:MAG: leucine-rich repeat protein [Eubacterium sp.]|nr:leucine-rich repeat protein [Eubacterium sp.]
MKRVRIICLLTMIFCLSFAVFFLTNETEHAKAKKLNNFEWSEDEELDYDYEILDDGTVEIIKYKGSDAIVDVPLEIDGANVSSIGSDAFEDCLGLIQVNLPDSVKRIGNSCFSGCRNMREINIPSGVVNIESFTFNGCAGLEKITIPDRVIRISAFAFKGCSSLKEVDIPNSVVSMGDSAFADCTNLERIHLSNSIDIVGIWLCSGCTALKEVNIPDGVTNIAEHAFEDCTGLRKISFPQSIDRISAEAFNRCTNLTDVYYDGTKEQWEKVWMAPLNNEPLFNATMHFKDDEPNIPDIILPAVGDAKQELQSLISGSSLSIKQDLMHYLSEEQITIIESCIYTWLAEINVTYKYSGIDAVKDLIMKKTGIDPQGNFTSGMEKAITHIIAETKYGQKTFEFTMDIGQPDDSGNLYPAYGAMHYEILESDGIPSDLPKSGIIGKEYYADLGMFAECVRKVSEDSLHSIYQWQSLSDELVSGILVDKTVTEIIGNKNISFFDGTFTVYVKPLFTYSKKVTISCPVDIYIYGMDGKEVGSIVNDQPSRGSNNVHLEITGDAKTVYLAGDDYYMNLRGTDTGKMKYVVEEIANEEVRRNVQFLELQLKKDMQYEGYVFRPLNIDRDLYALRMVNGSEREVFYADTDSYQSLFKRVESLSLSQKNSSLDADHTVQLTASLFPLDASNPNLRWATDNESVARVDENGLVTAIGSGRATVTVSTKDGSFLKQFCVIDVAGSNSADNNPGNPGGEGSGTGGSGNGGEGSGTGGSSGGENSGTGGNGSGGNGSGSTGGSSAGGFSPGGASTPDGTVQKPSVVKVHYVLQFDLNGGTKTSRRTMTLLSGDLPGIMPKAQRKDYVFNGWYTQAEGGTKVSGDKPLEEAATLYARWTKAAAPAKPASLKLQSKKKGQIQAGFQAVDDAAGYQVDYSVKKSFAPAKTKEAGKSAKAKTITGLKAGKKYYIRVRAYSLDSMGNRIYGPYSAVKSVIVKT